MSLAHAEATAYVANHHQPVTMRRTMPDGSVLVLEIPVLDAIADARAAVVRLAVTYVQDGASYTTNGSGTLVESGRFVLTAGHNLAPAPDLATADIRIHLPREVHDPQQHDREFVARVVDWRYGKDDRDVAQDWGLLAVVSPNDHMPSARTASAPSSTMLFCYGFPQQIGIDADGSAVPWTPDRRLEPVLVVVQSAASDPIGVGMPLFTPLAGCLPYGGMSGGPVLDASGAVTHILSGSNTWWGKSAPTHFVRGASIDAALVALAAATR